MILNNNYTTQSNQPAFKAAFKTDISVSDVKRLANIQKIFAAKTQHYVNDTLTLTMSKDPIFQNYPVVTTNTNKLGVDDYKFSHIIEPLDDLMETMSDNQIVKKLVNYFKMLKKEEAFDKCMDTANKKIQHLDLLKEKNEFTADRCLVSGNTAMADRYNALARNIQKKLDSVVLQKDKDRAQLIGDMTKIAENEPSLGYVPDFFNSPEFK